MKRHLQPFASDEPGNFRICALRVLASVNAMKFQITARRIFATVRERKSLTLCAPSAN